MPKPLLVYDSQCKVCLNQVKNLTFFLGDRFQKESFRDPEFSIKYPHIPVAECEEAVQFVDLDGRRFSGAEAVARVMAIRKIFLPLLWAYSVPGFSIIGEWFYKRIAKNRLEN